MKCAAWIFAACILTGAGVRAADREFSDVVQAIGDESHTRPTRIPLFGMVNAFAAMAHPGGAKHIDLAVFENVRSFSHDLPETIRQAVGAAWMPFLQVRSAPDRETVFAYVRQMGQEWKLLVIAIERTEATVLQLSLDADGLAKWTNDPGEHARHWRIQ
jgi:hypothetical protein